MGCCDSRPLETNEASKELKSPKVPESSIEKTKSQRNAPGSHDVTPNKSPNSGPHRSSFIRNTTGGLKRDYETIKKYHSAEFGDIWLVKDKRTGLFRIVKETLKSVLGIDGIGNFKKEIKRLRELVNSK